MSKEQVERTEREMFENFLDKIYAEYKLSELSYFERNLEVKICVMLRVIWHDQLLINEIFEADQLDRKKNNVNNIKMKPWSWVAHSCQSLSWILKHEAGSISTLPG